MTEENWNLVLYKAIASTSSWAALYFVAVILFGRYVLLNILVGIVVESFHDQVRVRHHFSPLFVETSDQHCFEVWHTEV